MSRVAATWLGREQVRILERLAVTTGIAKRSKKQSETLYRSYLARIHHEEEVWAAELDRWADRLFEQLNIEGAIRYAQRNWEPMVPEPAGKALWRMLRKAEPPEMFPPDPRLLAGELEAGVGAQLWIEGALNAYLLMAMQTSAEAGTLSLQQMGLNKTWAWASPRDMARDLYAVRGSKVIQSMYGAHIEKLRDIIIRATDPRKPLTIAQVQKLINDEWPGLKKWQVARITRTETAALWTHTSMQAYAANGITHWESTIAHGPTIGIESSDPCPMCVVESLTPHDMNSNLPPWHPGCRCEAVPLFENLDDGTPWLPPDEPWAGGAGVGESAPIIEFTDDAAARIPKGDGPILSPIASPGERMAMAPDPTNIPSAPYRTLVSGPQRRYQTYTPDGDIRAQITSCNNKISGLKTRLKKELDPEKRAALEQRLADQYALRDELKAQLGGQPKLPQKPKLPPPEIPAKPWKLGAVLPEDLFSQYKGHNVRVSIKNSMNPNVPIVVEGELSFDFNVWTIGGRTPGDDLSRIFKIEVQKPDGVYATVAETPKLDLPKQALQLDGSWDRLATIFRNLEGEDIRVFYGDGAEIGGVLRYNDAPPGWFVQRRIGDRVMDEIELVHPENIIRVDVHAQIDELGARYFTVAKQPIKNVDDLRAELTSTRNKISGLKTRLKRERAQPYPSSVKMDEIQDRLNALEKRAVEIKEEMKTAGKLDLPKENYPSERPGLITPGGEVPKLVEIEGKLYLDDLGPGSSPLADELAEIRAELHRRLNSTNWLRASDDDMRLVIQAGERIEAELARVRGPGDVEALDRAYGAAIEEQHRLYIAWNDALQVTRRELNRAAQARFGKDAWDLNNAEIAMLKREVPEVKRAAEAEAHIRVDYEAMRGAVEDAKENLRLAREGGGGRDDLLNVLGQVRKMGGGPGARIRYKEGADSAQIWDANAARGKGKMVSRQLTKTKKVLDAAERFMPRNWVTQQRPMDAGWIQRGHHGDRGAYQEMRLSSRRSNISGDPDGMPVAIHEMGHEVEATIKGVRALERAFYEYRTKDEELKQLRGFGYATHEKTREDKFSHPYMGKDYGGRSYEIVSMGLESIWTNSFRLDPEYRQFMLGLLGLL